MLDLARAVIADERAAIAEGTPGRSAAALARELLARLGALDGSAPVAGRVRPRARDQRDRRDPAHEPRARAVARAAIEAARLAAGTPSLLELDGETGRRGRRFRAVEDELIALTGAEDALVTNNNAAAVALAVGLAGRGGVAVSRGELVEIGGGVRIPEIVRRAGARLVEVGTTNRTRAADFEAAARGRPSAGRAARPSLELRA